MCLLYVFDFINKAKILVYNLKIIIMIIVGKGGWEVKFKLKL